MRLLLNRFPDAENETGGSNEESEIEVEPEDDDIEDDDIDEEGEDEETEDAE